MKKPKKKVAVRIIKTPSRVEKDYRVRYGKSRVCTVRLTDPHVHEDRWHNPQFFVWFIVNRALAQFGRYVDRSRDFKIVKQDRGMWRGKSGRIPFEIVDADFLAAKRSLARRAAA